MSAFPCSTITYFTPVCTSTSRSSLARALVPTKSCSTRLPLMPALSTATRDVPQWDCSRSARRFGQRWFMSGVEPKPSVTESPSVTIALARSEARTSTPVRK